MITSDGWAVQTSHSRLCRSPGVFVVPPIASEVFGASNPDRLMTELIGLAVPGRSRCAVDPVIN
jgi:hypothetical protein